MAKKEEKGEESEEEEYDEHMKQIMAYEITDEMQPVSEEEAMRLTVEESIALGMRALDAAPPINIRGKAAKYEWMHDAMRDISMLSNIFSKKLLFALSFGIALETAHPCKARKIFMEQLLRGSRSLQGKSLDRIAEVVKHAVTVGTEAEQESRIMRLWGRFREFLGMK